VTVRLREGLPTLRQERLVNAIRAVLRAAKERFGIRVVHYSIQSNHLHLVVEAVDRRGLSRGMRGLDIRLARAINRELGFRGAVLDDRYHSRVLKTPREVRNVLVYVLQNWRHHSRASVEGWDLASSAIVFDGWLGADPREDVDGNLLEIVASTRAPPDRCWLLKKGWKRHGLIRTTEAPR
jgi:REP element-mobilizing transposase RayT